MSCNTFQTMYEIKVARTEEQTPLVKYFVAHPWRQSLQSSAFVALNETQLVVWTNLPVHVLPAPSGLMGAFAPTVSFSLYPGMLDLIRISGPPQSGQMLAWLLEDVCCGSLCLWRSQDLQRRHSSLTPATCILTNWLVVAPWSLNMFIKWSMVLDTVLWGQLLSVLLVSLFFFHYSNPPSVESVVASMRLAVVSWTFDFSATVIEASCCSGMDSQPLPCPCMEGVSFHFSYSSLLFFIMSTFSLVHT